MKSAIIVTVSGFILLITIINLVCAFEEMRSDVYNLSQKEVILDGATFSGFYYDIDDNTGTEKLALRLSNVTHEGTSAILSDLPDSNGNRGIAYTVGAQPSDLSFEQWGQYEEIRFQGEDYFAGYDDDVTWSMKEAHQSVPLLYDRSEDSNLMANEQISSILIDDDGEQTINYTKPLELEEGYQLAVKTIDADGKKAQLELYKDGNAIDEKVIKLSDENTDIGDETYYYRKDLGATKDIVIIAVHFKHIFGGSSVIAVITDGIFQISDRPTSLRSVTNVNPIDMTITMDNKDNQVTLSKNKDQILIGSLHIKTADQDIIDAKNPLRYYVYKKYNDSGTYELHGSVANLSFHQFTWSGATFPGFYYDIDDNITTEQLTFHLSNASPDRATLSDQLYAGGLGGLVYTSTAQNKSFKFKSWGQYKVIGFLGDRYFAAYDSTLTQNLKKANQSSAYLYEKSKNSNLMTNEQISKLLMDTDTETTVTSDSPLEMEDGYQLAIKSVDVNGRKVQLDLSKNGQVLDTKIIQPSIDNAGMGDQTYYYKADLGETKEIIQIAVHFKNAFLGSDSSIATVDGIFQISDTPVSLKADSQFDKMSVFKVDPIALTITLDNKDNKITLDANKDISLMGGIHVYTADQGEMSDADPLRYSIYKYIDVEGDAPAIQEAVPGKAEDNNVQENATNEVEQTGENQTARAVATEDAQNITENPKTAQENSTLATVAIKEEQSKKLPGFQSAFAIAGLILSSYILFGRGRQRKGKSRG
jgi:S-layer protein (TIGR01567 family)